MVSTREDILIYLRHHPESSAADISRYLRLTIANIRYHLTILLDKGLVQISGKRSQGGPGRPILLYNLTSQALEESLIPLLEGLLEWINQGNQPETAWEQIAGQISDGFEGSQLTRVPLYNKAIDFLNGLNYHASWEAQPEGPEVAFKHCPYRTLALTHPQICAVDKELVSILFQLPMQLISRRSFDKNPFSTCVFQPEETKVEKG